LGRRDLKKGEDQVPVWGGAAHLIAEELNRIFPNGISIIKSASLDDVRIYLLPGGVIRFGI
jgi:hypothetical protein